MPLAALEEGKKGRENSPSEGWAVGITELMEVGGLAAIVMGREDVSRVSRYQEPCCPFLAEAESSRTWSFSYMLAIALARACLASTARSRARTRSGATQDGDPSHKSSGISTPNNLQL